MTPVAIADEQSALGGELLIAALLKRLALGHRLAVESGGKLARERTYGRVRSDSLPEHTRYRDDGCEVNPSCLTCPLARCRYDEPGGARALFQTPRDEAVRRRREEGLAIDALAQEFGLSRRSVFRILAKGREGNGRPSGAY